MRCRNCHTVMMETDPACPTCHSPAQRATAAAPGQTDAASNLLKVLPVFGGALGGLAYAALTYSEGSASSAARRTRGMGPVRQVIGCLLLLGGGLFLVLAAVHFLETWKIARREAKVATAADLCREDYPLSPPAWIAYSFNESKPVDVAVTRRRLGAGGNVQARYLLVRAHDKWLLATVAPGFEGNQLIGRLVPLDPSSSPPLLKILRKIEPKQTALLPFEFNGVEGSASDQRTRYGVAACIAVMGLVGLALAGSCSAATVNQLKAKLALPIDPGPTIPWAANSSGSKLETSLVALRVPYSRIGKLPNGPRALCVLDAARTWRCSSKHRNPRPVRKPLARYPGGP